jgi:shikimate dehydrogenase
VLERCDHATALCRRVGAVNTFWFERGELTGDNTDVGGFDAAARQLLGTAPRDMTVGVLGAGGAAAAILGAMESWPGCTALVHNRTPSRASELCARFSSFAKSSDVEQLAREADFVVNATSVGLRDDAIPLDPTLIRGDAMVLDLVYRPNETAWVRAARSLGHRAADGLSMLIEQGALAFERWFGFPPDRRVMWDAVR